MSRDIKNEILAQYRDKGGCKDIYRELYSAKDKAALVDVYITHPDWCMELDFPTLDSLRKDFSDLASRNIYVDRTFSGETINSQVAIFHNCKGHINVAMDYENAVIPMLYFCNGCNIHIECTQPNTPPIRVPLYIFGGNLITVNGRENAIFTRHEKQVKKDEIPH